MDAAHYADAGASQRSERCHRRYAQNEYALTARLASRRRDKTGFMPSIRYLRGVQLSRKNKYKRRLWFALVRNNVAHRQILIANVLIRQCKDSLVSVFEKPLRS